LVVSCALAALTGCSSLSRDWQATPYTTALWTDEGPQAPQTQLLSEPQTVAPNAPIAMVTAAQSGQPPVYGPPPGTTAPTYGPPAGPATMPAGVPVNPYGGPAALGTPIAPVPGQVGAPNEASPFLQAPGSDLLQLPPNYADVIADVSETQTGKITLGAAFNSDSGLVGQFIIDERNFDIGRPPRSFGEFIDGTGWRGAGQGFRLELVPGTDVQRYLLSFDEPYLFNTPISLTTSAYYFDRRYFDWDEERLGGRVAFGYRLTNDLSVSTGVRLENVEISNPRVGTSPELNAAVGGNGLYLGSVSLINDTRDHPFQASEGSYLELSYSQAFGDFDYPRGDIDYRRYLLIYERPDGSGRHTLAMGTRLGFTGSNTPVFENYFAGGFSTMRGFDFRGASPRSGGVIVGGEFQWLNTIEYVFPLTADDMIKGVLFTDFGTVEDSIEIRGENFRVAPGFGFRVHMPVGGAGGAPLAFDFAFPVAHADFDETEMFSFYLGVLR
jgi:outer membrane protein insertion porin family